MFSTQVSMTPDLLRFEKRQQKPLTFHNFDYNILHSECFQRSTTPIYVTFYTTLYSDNVTLL